MVMETIVTHYNSVTDSWRIPCNEDPLGCVYGRSLIWSNPKLVQKHILESCGFLIPIKHIQWMGKNPTSSLVDIPILRNVPEDYVDECGCDCCDHEMRGI